MHGNTGSDDGSCDSDAEADCVASPVTLSDAIVEIKKKAKRLRSEAEGIERHVKAMRYPYTDIPTLKRSTRIASVRCVGRDPHQPPHHIPGS